jgi:hypothetical protein
MAEVLVEFDAAFPGPDGAAYAPRACAREMEDGRWEGWIEFNDLDSGAVIRSARETTQPTRDGVMYWATGLTRVYLEGALARAMAGAHVVPTRDVDVEPAFDGPAPSLIVDVPPVPRAVLDPFAVYAQGEHVLRQELSALDIDHLHAIVKAFGLEGGVAADSNVPNVLIEYIVASVRAYSAGATGESASAKPADHVF